MELDVKDKKLIAELEKEGDLPLSSIAKKIGVSKEVAHYRVKQLTEKGIIKSFMPVIDNLYLGYRCYRLIINLQNLRPNARKQIVEYLRSKQDVEVTAFLFSNWDIDLKIWARHPGQFYDFYNLFIDKFSEYIAEKDFSLITGVHYLSHAHIHGHRSDLFIGKQYSQEVPEEEDAAILDALKKDARQDVVALARNCKLPLHIVRYRIKQLSKKGILKGVIPQIDTTKLGYNQYNVELILNQPSMRQSIVKHLKTLNPITRIYELIGRHDISFEAQFKSNDELDTFLEELRLHGNEIKDFQVMNMISK